MVSLNTNLLRPMRLGWSAWGKKEGSGVFRGGAARSKSAASCFSYLVAFSALSDGTFPFQLFPVFLYFH